MAHGWLLALMVSLMVMAKSMPRAPGPLIAVLAATVVVGVCSLQRFGIAVVGSVPAGLPVPALPTVEVGDVAALLLPAVGIAVVGFSDNALTGRAFATRHGEHVQANTELAALGATNVATALTHGFPVSCSGSRTTIADLLGAGTQLYALVTLVSVLDPLRRIAHAHDAVLRLVPDLAGLRDLDDYPAAKPIAGLVIYRYDAPLCFANAEDFRERALAAVDWSNEQGAEHIRWFVLSAEANAEVDLTALDAVEQVRDDLDACGLTARIGPERLFPTLATAIAAFGEDSGRMAHPGKDLGP